MKKVINYYTTAHYGVTREYVHDSSAADAAIIRKLAGQKTIDGRIRTLIHDLSGGSVTFVEVSSTGRIFGK